MERSYPSLASRLRALRLARVWKRDGALFLSGLLFVGFTSAMIVIGDTGQYYCGDRGFTPSKEYCEALDTDEAWLPGSPS